MATVTTKQDEEIRRLRSTHALWTQYAPEWDLYLAAYEGGQDFACEKHIFRHVRENEDDFKARAKRLHYLNYCQQLVDFFTNFIFSETIDRNGGKTDGEFFDAFSRNVDKKETTITDYMRQVSDESQIFGMCYTLVDAPVVDAGQVVTKQQEKDRGIRPYWVFIRPTEIVDWIVDDFDAFMYAKRRQFVNRVDGGAILTIERYTEFYVDQVVISEIDVTDTNKPKLLPQVVTVNTIGKIPLVVHRFKRSKRNPQMGNSFLRDFAFNNREIMNLTSLLQEFLYRQCFNILAKEVEGNVPFASQEEGDIGTSNVMEVPKNAKMPMYLSPPAEPAKFIQEERQRIRQEMFSRASQDTANELFNGESKSGFSQAQSFSKTVPVIASRADNLEHAENMLMALTMERIGKTWNGRIKYKDRYEITNVTDAMTQFVMMTRDLMIPSETFDKSQLTRLVKEFDGKLSAEVLAKVEKEIETMDYPKWKQLQKEALVGLPKPQGTSAAAQQAPKGSGTMAEVKAEAHMLSTAATKKLKDK